jgi:hypothetical protein
MLHTRSGLWWSRYACCTHQRNHRTHSVLKRRPAHPARLTGDGKIALSRTLVAPAFTTDKKSRCDVKFVNWLVRKNRALSMSKKDDELKVTDGAYNLSCVEVICVACQTDAGMGRRENQENSGCTSCRRDQDFHRL